MVKHSRKTITTFVCLTIFIAALLLSLLEYTGKIDLISTFPNSSAVDNDNNQAETTSTVTSAQSSFNGGSPRKEATQSNLNEGSVTDNNGQVSATTPQDSWTKSKDGTSLVVYSPTSGKTLTSGSEISGASTANKVNFRLIDNISGVIAQGTIAVVDGRFSGTFDFTTKATAGQVDVFTANADGVESNNVSIPVGF